jgi:hypothetical protein
LNSHRWNQLHQSVPNEINQLLQRQKPLSNFRPNRIKVLRHRGADCALCATVMNEICRYSGCYCKLTVRGFCTASVQLSLGT